VGDKAKVARLENRITDWKRDLMNDSKKLVTKEDMVEEKGQTGEGERGGGLCREPTECAELWFLLPPTYKGGKEKNTRKRKSK
jgi:hypothetical protein